MVGTSDHEQVFGRRLTGEPTRSALIHAQRAERDRARVRADRQLRTLGAVATEREEDEALERATGLISRGGVPGRRTRELALRALIRQGGGPKLSSAEQHAAGYLSRGAGADDDDHSPEFTV
jgi:hypothetical protein